MIIDLTVSVPSSADVTEVKEKLAKAAFAGEGLTIVTAQRYYVDVDIVGIDMRMEVAQ